MCPVTVKSISLQIDQDHRTLSLHVDGEEEEATVSLDFTGHKSNASNVVCSERLVKLINDIGV